MNKEKTVWVSTLLANSLFATAITINVACATSLGVSLFGVSGAVFLARGEQYIPYILIAILLLLVWSFWQVYRNKVARVASTSGETKLPLKLTILLWFPTSIILVVALIIIYSLITMS